MANVSAILKSLSKLAPGFQDIILYPGKKGGVKVYVSTAFAQAIFTTDLQLSLETPIQIKTNALQDATAKRANVELSLEDEMLCIKDRNTKISIQSESVAVTPPQTLEKIDGLVEVSMSDELFTALNTILPSLRIEKIHDAQQDFRLFAEFGEKSTTLAVFDAHQMAFIRMPKTFPGISGSFNLPYDRFTAILKDCPVSSFRILLGEDTIMLFTKAFQSITNTPPSEGLTGDISSAILGKIKQLSKFAAKTEVSVDLEELNTFISSCRAVATDDARLIFETKKKKVKIMVVSATGSAEIILPNLADVVEEHKFAVEIKLVRNMSSKCKDTFSVMVSEEEIFLKGTTCYVGMLSEVS